MGSRTRRIAITFMETASPCADEVQTEGREWFPFSYGAYRVLAAAKSAYPDDDIRIFQGDPSAPQRLADELEAFDPDLVGGSTYVWSFASTLEVVAQLRARRPDRAIVLGGPCARPAMFELAPFRRYSDVVDALVSREGEDAFVEILATDRPTRASMAEVEGVCVASPLGFRPARPRKHYRPLDEYPSPFRLGLHPPTFTPHLETFRGCPLHCAFCEWGVQQDSHRVVSEEWLTEELETFRRLGASAVYMVDAGLNLNSRAFRNLAAAERRTGVLKDRALVFMVYPDYVQQEHIEFLSQIHLRHITIGLQTTTPRALEAMHRRYDPVKFRRGATMLRDVAPEMMIELILGLPGDDPDSFIAAIELGLSFGPRVGVLVYRCLVLPDGLMTRAPAGYDLRFDPYSLRLTSCVGWSESDIRSTEDRIRRLIEVHGGQIGDEWFQIRRPSAQLVSPDVQPAAALAVSTAATQPVLRPRAPVEEEVVTMLGSHVLRATDGAWRVARASREERSIVVVMQTKGQEVVVEVAPAREDQPSYRTVASMAWSYRGQVGVDDRKLLEAVVDSSAPIAPRVLASFADQAK